MVNFPVLDLLHTTPLPAATWFLSFPHIFSSAPLPVHLTGHPNLQDDTDSSLRPMSRRMAQSRSPVGSNLQSLFQGHPMVISHMVPTLLRLYVDVEFTDQHNQVGGDGAG